MPLKIIEEKVFEDIKHLDYDGNEFWDAKELMQALEFKEWRKFKKVINKAKKACELNGSIVKEHFITINQKDYKLSRYACYLISQNGNQQEKIILVAKNYFSVQTNKDEISLQEYNKLPEDEKRFYQRNLIRKGNFSLNQIARDVGVKNFDKFHNWGYKGLYNGETANDIAKRKQLRYREDILDNMSSEELEFNLIRINRISKKLKNNNINTERDANKAHYIIGQEVRSLFNKLVKMFPEKLPTPKKSLKELQKEKRKMNNKQTKKH